MTTEMQYDNYYPLAQPIFDGLLAPNHHELLAPPFLQGEQRKVTAAIRVYGVKGNFTDLSTKVIGGRVYKLILGQLQGTTEIEEVEENGQQGYRYGSLKGYFASPLHLPQETYGYLGETFTIPPETQVTFMIPEEDLEVIREASQISTGAIQNGKGEFSKTQNTWVIKTEVDLYQAVTIISPTTKDAKTGKAIGFRHVPGILLQEPIHLVPGENIMAYTNLEALNFPFTRLTIDELSNPLITYLIELINRNREEGYLQSVFNGTRALTQRPRNKALPSIQEVTADLNKVEPTHTTLAQRERTPVVTGAPSSFMGSDEPKGETSSRPSTSLRPTTVLSGRVALQ